MWKLIAVEGKSGVYYLYNNGVKMYISPITGGVQLVEDIADAGEYQVIPDTTDGSTVYFKDDALSSGMCYLNSNTVTHVFSNWTADNGCRFYLRTSDEMGSAAEKVAWVKANTGTDIGDFKPEKVNDLIATLEADSSNREAYEQLESVIADEESIVLPIPGHFYQIESAFPYYSNLYLRETYYEKDWHVRQSRQRVLFHFADWDEDVVPSFWKFEAQEPLNGTDSQHYYMLRAVNSEMVARLTMNNTVVDVRPDTDAQAGVFSIVKNSLATYPHSVAIKSHYNNDDRSWVSGHSLLGIWRSADAEVNSDASIRDGKESPITQTEEMVEDANIWYVREVTTFPIYFSHTEEGEESHVHDGLYYNTYCFPFAVQVPSELKAYSGAYALLNEDGTTKSLVNLIPFETSDGRTDVIPANSPAIISAPDGGPYYLTVLYDATYPAVDGIGLIGANMPKALDSGQVVYILHDDRDSQATRIEEGVDYSYDPTDLHTASTNLPNGSLHGSDSTYIIDSNKAVIEVTTDAEVPTTADLEVDEDVTTGIRPTTDIPATDAAGNIIYYDLTGRRVVNPLPGFYILSNGEKVLIR